MTDFLRIVPSLAQDAGPTGAVLAVLLRVTVLLTAALLVAAGLRRSSAALRHLLWTLSLVGTLLIPLLWVIFPAWQWAIFSPGQPALPTALAARAISEAPIRTAESRFAADTLVAEPMPPLPVRPIVVASPYTGWSWPAALAALWAAGSVLGLVRLVFGVAAACYVAAAAKPAADPRWQSMLRQVLDHCGCRRPVEVCQCARIAVPMTWGLRRPRILVPPGSAAWPEATRRSVLLHELGHIRRGDCLLQLVGRLACAAYWFDPLVWLAARRWRTASEQAADDVVLSAGVAPPDYAERLVAIAAQVRGFTLSIFGPAALPMGRPSELEGRVSAILDRRRSHRGLGRTARYASVIVAALLLVPCALVRLGYAKDQPPPSSAYTKDDTGTAGTSDLSESRKPVLRKSGPLAAPTEFVERLVKTNLGWLYPDWQELSYTFSMKHPGKNDRTTVKVQSAAPDVVMIEREHQPPYRGSLGALYDPADIGYLPKRMALLQGVNLFGPLQALAPAPSWYTLKIVGEEKIDGRDVWVLHLEIRATRGAEDEARTTAQQEACLREIARKHKYLYELTPIRRTVDGKAEAVIELKCAGPEGPRWKELLAAREKNPHEIRWEDYRMTAAIQEYHGQVQPVIVLEFDPEDLGETSASPVPHMKEVTPMMELGDGEMLFDETRYRQLKDQLQEWKEERKSRLPMRIGCGIFGQWYSYSRDGVDVDQLWVEKDTCRVLREEGFRNGEPRFVATYDRYEPTADNGQVPRQIVVRLLSSKPGSTYPWVFRMDFQLLGGTTWLLKELKESQGQQQNVAVAAVTDVRQAPVSARAVSP